MEIGSSNLLTGSRLQSVQASQHRTPKAEADLTRLLPLCRYQRFSRFIQNSRRFRAEDISNELKRDKERSVPQAETYLLCMSTYSSVSSRISSWWKFQDHDPISTPCTLQHLNKQPTPYPRNCTEFTSQVCKPSKQTFYSWSILLKIICDACILSGHENHTQLC